jgi:superfamily II DNA or RNA helicase
MSVAIANPEPEPAPAVETTEAYQTLLARVGRKSPKLPPEALVLQVLKCVPAQEWPARVEAMDALLRRLESARNDGLRIATRPPNGALLGPYTTKRPGSESRPYRTSLHAVEPFEGRCDCPDFLKNSLGVCKHILVVLENLHAKPRLLERARKEQQRSLSTPAAGGLWWDPVRPLTGAGDWLERVVWLNPSASKTTSELSKWFRLQGQRDGALVLKKLFADDPSKRLALVDDLLKMLPRGDRADPALKALLTRERERLGRVGEQALKPSELRAAVKGLKRSLYPYQREGVERFLTTGRLLLADDMGLGKTAQAISCCDILRRAGRVRRGLVIAPASLKPQWAREWERFSDLPVTVVDGSPTERQAMYEKNKNGFFIINYEQLIRDLDVIRKWAPDLVVLDEAQRIKNWATKTALSVKGLEPAYRLVLTGTPMENRIEELASVVEWVDDLALEPKWRLGAVHAVHADGRREVTGVRNLDTLRDRLRPCMLRRIRQEVLDQLPPRTDVRVPIELTEPQRGEHDALIQPIVALMQRAKVRPLTQVEFLRLMSLLTTQRIISNGLSQLHFEEVWPSIRGRDPEESVIAGLSSPKLLELRQLVRQIVTEQGRKVVVFSQWRRMLTLAQWAVNDLLRGDGLRAGFFTGAEGRKRRTQNIVEFHDDPHFRILFASDAGGVGLNLQHASNCVINMELPWNPAVLEQRIGRIYRLGQSKPIDVYNLVCEEGIESRIAGLVGSKQAFFKGLFDGDSDAVQFDQTGSFLARVEKLYESAVAASPAPGADAVALEEPADTGLDLDDEVADPFEPLIEAADESEDRAVVAPEPEQELVVSEEPAPSPQPHAPPGDVRRLFSQLQIRRETDGRVVIEAPAEAASALSALFEGMAALMQSVATPRDGQGPA